MVGERKYLRRPDINLIIEFDPILLEIVLPFLQMAEIPYEILDSPPEIVGEETEREEENSSSRRRR
jgi:hypothetical protein